MIDQLMCKKAFLLSKELVWAPLVLFLTWLLLTYSYFHGYSMGINQDNTYMYLPLFSLASRVFNAGEYPYWASSLLGGLPLYNSPQFTLDYPFYLLHLNIWSTAEEAIRATQYVVLFHYLILLINSYILMRALSLAPLAAYVGAIIGAFSANITDYMGMMTLIAPYSWLPLVIGSFVFMMHRERRIIGCFLCILSMAMLVLSAPSLPFIHCCFIGGVLVFCYSIICLWRKSYRELWAFALAIGVAGICSFAILSPYLISELTSLSGFIRWVGEAPPLIGHDRIPFHLFLLGQLSFLDLLQVVFPAGRRFLIGNPYLGMPVIMVALLALLQIKKQPIHIVWVVLAIWGLLSSLGANAGMAYFNYHIPFVNLMREPVRHLYVFGFCMSILAALGVDLLITSYRQRSRELLTKYYRLASLVVVAFLITSLYLLKAETSSLIIVLSSLALVSLIVFTLSSGILRGATLLIFTVILLVNTILPYPLKKEPIAQGDYYTAWNLKSHKILQELSRLEDIKDYRVIFEDQTHSQKWSMNASYYEIRTFNVYFNPLPYKQFTQMYYHGYQYANWRELLGAKYAVCEQCSDWIKGNFILLRELEGYKIYKNDRALPRLNVINQLYGQYSKEAEFYIKINNGYDFRQEIFAQDTNFKTLQAHLGGQKIQASASCRLENKLITYNKIQLISNCERNEILLFNEYYSDDWQVRINGKAIETYEVNLNQLAIPLSPGSAIVEIEYRPRVFANLRLFSQIMASVLSLCAAIYFWFRIKVIFNKERTHES
ncbi:MAG: hypothetical protein IT292_06760 [Deltaproteobacteria bacterium]|nr:hypothetical protein [Deltaproteobacteria bacterium]